MIMVITMDGIKGTMVIMVMAKAMERVMAKANNN
jgi:hypothetical protein